MAGRSRHHAAAAESLTRYNRWTAPEADATVAFQTSVVRSLKDQALAAFHALPKRGVEVGGVLFGRFVDDDPLHIQVDGFEEVPCEHKFGPSFVLSETDREKLEEILARPPDPGLSVVGYYRSCTGRDIALDPADEDLLQTCFPGDRQIVLSIKPLPSRKCLGWLFSRRRASALPTEPAGDPFPFDTGGAEFEPVVPIVEEPVRPPDPPPVIEAAEISPEPPQEPDTVAPVPEPEPGAPRRGAERRRRHRELAEREQRLWPWVAFLMAMIIGCAYLYEWWLSRPATSGGKAGLEVTRTSSDIRVSWDRSAPEAQRATRGVLSVTAGHEEERIELSSADIVRGEFAYQPSDHDVYVRLTLYESDAQLLTESRRLNAVAKPEEPPAAASAPAEPPQVEQAIAEEGPQTRELAVQPPAVDIAEPSAESSEETRASGTNAPPAVRDAPPAREDNTRVAVPAKLVHQVRAGVPEGIQARIRSPITVPVVVRIDASGKVVSAVPPRGGDGLHSYLATRAAAAALSSRFEPARSSDGKPVPSAQTLYFTFR
ncbi:MAG: hypothetical protein KIT09_26420 [Bryobacteraceae bacterium]|nr:hypothetical protein [Bryobacteraceae bacterium]